MIAAAATLACWLAMWPDLGISGAGKVASPSTWMPGAAVDSIVSQFTPTQRLFMFSSPALRARSPARCGGMTLSTSAFTSSNSSLATLPDSSFSSAFGRYSSDAVVVVA